MVPWKLSSTDVPEIFVDTRNFESHKQCEIRRPSERGYFFDIVWIRASLARKSNILTDESGNNWIVHEIWGTKKLPTARMALRQA